MLDLVSDGNCAELLVGGWAQLAPEAPMQVAKLQPAVKSAAHGLRADRAINSADLCQSISAKSTVISRLTT